MSADQLANTQSGVDAPQPPSTVAQQRVARGIGRVLLCGDVPYAAVLILAAGAFLAGEHAAPIRDKVAVAEKGAIVLEALLARPNGTPQEIDAQLRQPILTVFRKYAARGYTVIDSSKDEAGNMAVVAIPPDAIDITAEVRHAVQAAEAHAATAPKPAAESASLDGLPKATRNHAATAQTRPVNPTPGEPRE
jgi:hypothetical protein